MSSASQILTIVVTFAIGMTIVLATGTGWYVVQVTASEPVDAEVVSSEVTTKACGTDQACDVRYFPSVTYRYTYDGQQYTSEQVFPDGGKASGEARAEEIVSEHSKGDRVTAHVVPWFPGKSYLVGTRPNLVMALFSMFGGLLVLGGISGTIQLLRGVDPSEKYGYE